MNVCPVNYNMYGKERNGKHTLCRRSLPTHVYPKYILVNKDGSMFAHQYQSNKKELCLTKKEKQYITCDIHDNIYTPIRLRWKKKKSKKRVINKK